MISLIIKSYFVILLSVGLGASLLFAVGIYLIFRHFYGDFKVPEIHSVSTQAITPQSPVVDIHASELAGIAGDNLAATQLDLARAYLEIENYPAAIKLLESIGQNGNEIQKSEAMKLLNHIFDLQFVQQIKQTSR